MKKTVQAISLGLIVILLASALIACSTTTTELAGTYSGSYEYNGNVFHAEIVLNKDGTYSKTMTKNGYSHSSSTGDYLVVEDCVRLYTEDDHSAYTEYKYTPGQLENNGHIFEKQ